MESNARQIEYWNSAATRAWTESHEAIDRLFAGITQIAMEAAAPRVGEQVIDIGCGSGTTVLDLAARVGPSGHVLGADISEASIARAGERIAAAGLTNAEVAVIDVSNHTFSPKSFDLAFSRFGVMFFADPTVSFANLRPAMKPGGRLALAVWRTAQENRWSTAAMEAVQHLLPPVAPPGPEEPGPNSWADPARVRRILEGAGFRNISLAAHDATLQIAPAGGAKAAADFGMRFGRVARAIVGAPPEQRDAVRATLESFFEQHETAHGIVFPSAFWMVGARA